MKNLVKWPIWGGETQWEISLRKHNFASIYLKVTAMKNTDTTKLLKQKISAFFLLVGSTALPGMALAHGNSYSVCPTDPIPDKQMCALGWPDTHSDPGFDQKYHFSISADGSTIIGKVDFNRDGTYRAFRWINSGSGMLDLGTLNKDNLGAADAVAVSADGSVIVGQAATDDLHVGRAFRWMNDGNGMLDLGSLKGADTGWSWASSVSADGSVIAGQAETSDHSSRAFRWMDDGNGMLDLGTLRASGSGWSNALGVSADGTTIIGQANTDDPGNRAFRWTEAKGMQDLGTLRTSKSGNSYAFGVSADGAVVVGQSDADGGFERAFRWMDDGNGMLDLGSLQGPNTGWSWAAGVSADGTVIAGHSSTDDGAGRAFRWTFEQGMYDLGTLRHDNTGGSNAHAISADGGVIIGRADTDDHNERAFRWSDDGKGMIDLGTLRTDNLGWSYASAVSADGSVITGLAEADSHPSSAGGEGPSFTSRAFIWRSGVMLDHLNTAASVFNTAQALAASSAFYSQLAEWQIADELAIEGPGISPRVPVLSTQGTGLVPQGRMALRFGGSLRDTSGVSTTAGADISVAIALGGGYTLGGFLDLSRETNSRSPVSLRGSYLTAGTWLRYRENIDRTGLTWRIAASAGTGRFDVTRRDILPGTERGEGRTRMRNAAMSAELGYGFALGNGVAVPFARLTGTRTTRSGYNESSALAFPLSFDSYRETALVLTLGTDMRFAVSDRSSLEVGLGVSHDLRRSIGDISGASRINGLEDFSISGPSLVNRTRGYATMGYVHGLEGGAAIRADLSVAQSPWSKKPKLGLRLGYEMRF